MSFIQALLLGVIQGITEFLPVSSSGHLAIIENLFKIETDTGLLFNTIIHLGTLAAIFIAFRQDIKKLLLEGCKALYDIYGNVQTYFHNKHQQDAKRYKKIISNNYRKLFLLLFVSTIPTAFLGFLLQNVVAQAGKTLLAPAMGLFITGILLLVVDFFPAGKKIPKDVTYSVAFLLGICQGIAVFPGISRAGITIAVCLLCGFNRKFAVKYSFLMAIPAMLGAALLELFQFSYTGENVEAMALALFAAVVAGIVGYFCIKGMLAVMRKKRFRIFSVYCFLLGVVAIVCNFI